MKTWKGIVTLVLAVLMLCAVLPGAALAEDEIDLTTEEAEIAFDDLPEVNSLGIRPDEINDLELSLDDAALGVNALLSESGLSTEENVTEAANATKDVKINNFNFPDANFRNYVKRFDYDGNGVLSVEECATVEEIDVKDCGISSLGGIGNFSNLKRLDCSHNQLTGLDLGGCMDLSILDCSHNQLSHLYLNKRPALKELSCSNNQLEELDLSGCTALTVLSCSNNQIINLNILEFTALKEVDCSNNQITNLDIMEFTALKEVDCSNNQIEGMCVFANTALESLDCSNNQLKNLDLCDNTALESVDCSNNRLQALNASNCPAVKKFSCSNNQLSKLNVSNCRTLKELSCSNNQLSALDLDIFSTLKELSCSNNQLESLDLLNNTALESLDCSNNRLPSLDVSECTELSILACYGNSIDKLDLRNCKSLIECVKEGKHENTPTKDTYSLGSYRLECDHGVNLITDSMPQHTPPEKVSIKDCEIEDIAAQTYNGKAIRPAPVVKHGGKTLKKGTDYTLSYANNRNIGTATVTIEGKGDYSDSVKKTFDINPKAVKLCSVKAGKKKLTVKWKKGPGGVKYEIQYSRKKDFSKAKTVKTSKTSTVRMVIRNLKSHKTYYIRIRAYKKVNGKKYVSAWSKALSKKVR